MSVKASGPNSRTGQRRNGLTPDRPRAYPYRGLLTLEADLRYECLGGCGRRSDVEQVCAVCRGYYERAHTAGR